MTKPPTYLRTGAGGGAAGISTRVVEQLLARRETVRALVHREDSRSEALRDLRAEVIVGDLANPVDVGAAMFGVTRMFFNMSVSPDYLEATAVVCVAAQEGDALDVLVNMSQMTVSQMTATSTEESPQQRLHDFDQLIGGLGFAPVPVGGLREGGGLVQVGGLLNALHVLQQDSPVTADGQGGRT